VTDGSSIAAGCRMTLLLALPRVLDREVASNLRCLEALDIAGHTAKARAAVIGFSFSSAAEAGVDVRL
jgi:hypothetical protein